MAVYGLAVRCGWPIDTAIFRELAGELEREGDPDSAERCWDCIHRLTPYNRDGLLDYLVQAVTTGSMSQVRWLARRIRSELGLPPGNAIWLAGLLACHGHYREAGEILEQLASFEEDHRLISRFPSAVSGLIPDDISGLARSLRGCAGRREEIPAELLLALARLCFTFQKPEPAARLYRKALAHAHLSPLDTVAMLHAHVRTGLELPEDVLTRLPSLRQAVAGNADALAMLAFVFLALEDCRSAEEALELAIRLRYADVSGVDAIVDDCRVMFRCVTSLRRRPAELPGVLLAEGVDQGGGAVPKVFVCGFGWSGSGAVYDEIRGIEGFCEFQGAGDAPLLNADSGSETTFIQSEAGLGALWLGAKSTGRIGWQWMWDMLCLHVAGLSGIGYNGYKSCAAAFNNVRRYGTDYSGPFRRFLESYVRMLDEPVPGGLLRLMQETTESLCAMLMRREGGRAVLFNNAVFGKHVAMLRIFRNCRAVVVFRDPLDVYVDRVRSDRNHWRPPRLLAELYAQNLRQYIDCRARDGEEEWRVREVPFERFVTDADFRRRVRTWLLDGVLEDSGASHFDPNASIRNIGIHHGILSLRDRKGMGVANVACRDMRRLAEAAWAADSAPRPGGMTTLRKVAGGG